MKKIYIAGPDVFEQNAVELGNKYVKLCEKHGFIGLYPLDNEIDTNLSKKATAKAIFDANVELIRQADIVIANLNPFRGKEADSGTVWECGYAHGLGKKVYGYMQNTSPYISKFKESEKQSNALDKEGKYIEDFELPVNLMIACSVEKIIEGGLEDVLRRVEK